jgi:Phage integrase family
MVKCRHGICRLTGIETPTKTRSGMGADGKGRPLWLPKQALDAARQILEMRGNPTSGPLLLTREGGSIHTTMYNNHLLGTLKEAGIPREESKGVIHFHSTRHRSTSEMKRLGVSKDERKKTLGHSRRHDITDDYTHDLPEIVTQSEAQRAAQEIIDHYMPDVITPTAEIMKVKPSREYQYNTDERRARNREYMRKHRERKKLADAQRTNQT